MINIALFNTTTGAITLTISVEASDIFDALAHDAVINKITAGVGIAEGAVDFAASYVDVTGYTLDELTNPALGVIPVATRPVSPTLPATGVAPMSLDDGFTGWPDGTVVTATNALGEAVTVTLPNDPADPLTLEGADAYTVTVAFPWPYLPATQTIEVS